MCYYYVYPEKGTISFTRIPRVKHSLRLKGDEMYIKNMMRRAAFAAAAMLALAGGLAVAASPAEAASGSAVTIKTNGKCLDADLNRINNDGAKIQLWDCNGSNQQKWYWGAGNTIRSGFNGKCLDADANSGGVNGTKVQLWSCNGTAQQRWSKWGGQIRNSQWVKCLDADANTINSNGAKVQLWSCNNTNQQYWNKLSDSKKSQDCPAYGNDRIVQNTGQIARIREQVCIYYDSAIVYAVARMQIDWPSLCNVEVGLPPTSSVSCPLSSWSLKDHEMHYDAIKVGIDFQAGNGNVVSGTCSTSGGGWAGHPTDTSTCRYGYAERVAGRQYKVTVHDTGIDLYGDHTGYQLMNPGDYTFRP